MSATKAKKKLRRRVIVIVVLVLLIGAAVTLFLLRPKDAAFTEEKAKSGDITTYYSFSGNIEAKERQSILADKVMQIKTLKVKEGDTVKRTGRIASIQVGEGMLGRVINPLGETLDGFGLIGGETTEMPLERKAPGVIFRQPVNQPLQTGLKAVDAMIPIGRGQRELIIGDRQTSREAKRS